MLERFSTESFPEICRRLALADKDLAKIILEHGLPPMWTRPNTFETIVHIILEQQVSLASALSALNRLKERTVHLTPENLLLLNDEELRACYVSRQKAIYLRGLAAAITNGDLALAELDNMPDDEVRISLTRLKGIGNWTADIYLMFVLQRPDIFPMGDLAAVNALLRAKGLSRPTSPEILLKMTDTWSPYRSIATMILWHHYLSAPIGRKG